MKKRPPRKSHIRESPDSRNVQVCPSRSGVKALPSGSFLRECLRGGHLWRGPLRAVHFSRHKWPTLSMRARLELDGLARLLWGLGTRETDSRREETRGDERRRPARACSGVPSYTSSLLCYYSQA